MLVPAPGGAGELAGLLEDGRPESPLLTLPLGAVFEEVLLSLDAVLTPPAGRRIVHAGQPIIFCYFIYCMRPI